MTSVVATLQGLLDEFRVFLEELATTEGRLAVSAVLLLVTALIAIGITPVVVRRLGQSVERRLPTGRTKTIVELLSEYIPTSVGGLVLRAVQLVLFIGAIVSLLVVWGLVDLAREVLLALGISLPLLGKLFATLALFFFAYVAADLLGDAVEEFSDGAGRITDHQQEIILRLGHVGIIGFALGGTLTLWGIDLSGLLVGAGFLGIVVGLAARQTLGSIIAGFVLMFSRPFTIGDWVEVESSQGIVTNITIMNTHMRNFDGEYIVIPNDTISNKPITNRSKEGHLRTRVDVGIDYAADPEFAEEIAMEAIADADAVSTTPPPQVVPKSFGDSSVVLEMRFWIDRPTPPRRWRAISEVIHAVKNRFDEEGIKIPYPQRELSGRAETDGFRVQNAETPSDEIRTEREGSLDPQQKE